MAVNHDSGGLQYSTLVPVSSCVSYIGRVAFILAEPFAEPKLPPAITQATEERDSDILSHLQFQVHHAVQTLALYAIRAFQCFKRYKLEDSNVVHGFYIQDPAHKVLNTCTNHDPPPIESNAWYNSDMNVSQSSHLSLNRCKNH